VRIDRDNVEGPPGAHVRDLAIEALRIGRPHNDPRLNELLLEIIRRTDATLRAPRWIETSAALVLRRVSEPTLKREARQHGYGHKGPTRWLFDANRIEDFMACRPFVPLGAPPVSE
jgi:hypothetical protein